MVKQQTDQSTCTALNGRLGLCTPVGSVFFHNCFSLFFFFFLIYIPFRYPPFHNTPFIVLYTNHIYFTFLLYHNTAMSDELSLQSLCQYHTRHFDFIHFCIKQHIIRPLHRECPYCHTTVTYHLQRIENISDKYKLYCPHCYIHMSVREGTIFHGSELSLMKLCKILSFFIHKATVTTCAEQLQMRHATISHWYEKFRSQLLNYFQLLFPDMEIIEIDEIHLRGVRELMTGEYIEDRSENAGDVLGLVGRNTGKIWLEPLPDKTEHSIRTVIEEHVPFDTVLITDQWASYRPLADHYEMYECVKWHLGAACGPTQKIVTDSYGRTLQIHTNTIEGTWSQLRDMIHHSHGFPPSYLPPILAEFMYRKLNIPFLPLLSFV